MLSAVLKITLATLSLCVCLNLLQSFLCCNYSNFTSMCHDYFNGKVNGPLCSTMCDAEKFQIKQCLTRRMEKQVFQATLNEEPVILKYSFDWSRGVNKWHSEISKDFGEETEINEQTVSERFKSAIKNIIDRKFGTCSNCKMLVENLQQIADLDSNGVLNMTEGGNFLGHLENNEALMLLVLNDSDYTLDFLGYCGGFYAVEQVSEIVQNVFGIMDPITDVYLPYLFPVFLDPVEDCFKTLLNSITMYLSELGFRDQLSSWTYKTFLETRTPDWRERFNFTYSLLDILYHMQSNRYGPIYFCDLHSENIGLTANKSYKILDFDDLVPKHLAISELSSTECSTHHDCKIGDYQVCIGLCDEEKGFCRDIIVPQDLRLFCRSLISAILLEDSPGILGLNPIPAEMKERAPFIEAVIEHCHKIPLTFDQEEIRKNIISVKNELREIEKMEFKVLDDRKK